MPAVPLKEGTSLSEVLHQEILRVTEAAAMFLSRFLIEYEMDYQKAKLATHHRRTCSVKEHGRSGQSLDLSQSHSYQ